MKENHEQTDGAELINHEPQQFELTESGMIIRGNPSFEAWEAVGQQLRKIRKGYQWWFGDWLNYGERTFANYAQAVEASDLTQSTLTQYAYVARNVPPENRSEHVDFGHYSNGIASLPPEDQQRWVKKIIASDLTQQQFKTQLKAERAIEGKPVTFWLVVACNDLDDLAALEKRLQSEGRVVKTR